MELQNDKKDEHEKAFEVFVVENDEYAGKDGEVVVEAKAGKKDENEAVETSAGEESKVLAKFVETSTDEKQEEAALEALVKENETANGIVEEPSVEASSSGIKKLQGLRPKNKIIKKVKRLVKRKILKRTTGQVAGKENATVEEGIKDGITAINIKKDEQIAEQPSLDESEKEIVKVIESVVDSLTGKDKDSETSVGVNDIDFKKDIEEIAETPQPKNDDEKVAVTESSGKEILKQVKGNASSIKSVGKRLQKGKKVKESAAILQGPKEGMNLDSVESDKRDAIASPMEAEKVIEGSVEAPENVLLANALEVNDSEGDQQKTFAKKNKQNPLTDEKPGLLENKRRRRKRQGKQVLGSNKKQKKDEIVAADDATQQKTEERKKQLVNPENDGRGKVKIGGLIFMCNSKTKPDCFRYNVMGVQENKKEYVMSIKPGLKLFLFDYDLKLFYGIFEASSAGGMKLERNAFGGSFPAQVRFKVFRDCLPLSEREFKKAIKEVYNNKNKFKTELTRKQVYKLEKLFRPAPLPTQETYTQQISVPRDSKRKRSQKDRYAPGSSRTQSTPTHERRWKASPSPRREEPPRDLYISEREYRAYGLRRTEPIQHYPIPPPDTSYRNVNRDHVLLESYHPPVDHDRVLRLAEIERHHDRREAPLLSLPDRDYRLYDHLSSRREILARNSPNPPAPAVTLDSYRRVDPYYSYEHRAPERPARTYLGREEDDLYSRYVTADSLAEYYRSSSSRRYPSTAESEPLPSSLISRYAYFHR